MKSRTQLIITSLLFSTLFLSACKKDIASPSDESKQLFGTWEWIGSSGGITGGGMPESVDIIHSLEFNKNGQVNK